MTINDYNIMVIIIICCNFRRALLVGSCLGAKLGVEGIPMEWIEKVWSEYDTLSYKLFCIMLCFTG